MVGGYACKTFLRELLKRTFFFVFFQKRKETYFPETNMVKKSRIRREPKIKRSQTIKLCQLAIAEVTKLLLGITNFTAYGIYMKLKHGRKNRKSSTKWNNRGCYDNERNCQKKKKNTVSCKPPVF